jgi:hypothetical protein
MKEERVLHEWTKQRVIGIETKTLANIEPRPFEYDSVKNYNAAMNVLCPKKKDQ